MTNLYLSEPNEARHLCSRESCETSCEGCGQSFCRDNPEDDGKLTAFDNGWDRHSLCWQCVDQLEEQEKIYLR